MSSVTGTSNYRVAILEDRYQGAYSGGEWLAISKADDLYGDAEQSRLQFVSLYGPSADDVTCMKFWDAAPDWIAAGATSNQAVENLCEVKF